VDRTGLSNTVRWAGSYEVTPPWWVGGWGRQVNMRTAPGGASAGYWVRPHPGLSCSSGKACERLAGNVAFETAHDLSG
jgi:hypothetical protein